MTRNRRHGQLACQQLVELVNDYLEGGLKESDRVAVEVHLAQCDGCRSYVDQIRRMLVLLHQTPADPVPPELLDMVTLRFRERG